MAVEQAAFGLEGFLRARGRRVLELGLDADAGAQGRSQIRFRAPDAARAEAPIGCRIAQDEGAAPGRDLPIDDLEAQRKGATQRLHQSIPELWAARASPPNGAHELHPQKLYAAMVNER
jgi:hypothetical protein